MAHDTEQPLLQDSGREPEAHEAECTGGEKLACRVVVSDFSMLAASNVDRYHLVQCLHAQRVGSPECAVSTMGLRTAIIGVMS